jgi:CRP-like cAMP-binding protein
MDNKYVHKVLRRLMPICNLSDDKFEQLMHKTVLEEMPAGEMLFREGETDNKTFYLLTGELILSRSAGGSQIIAGGSKITQVPVAHKQPRQETARTKSNIGYVGFDSDFLNALLTLDQTSAGEPVEKEIEDEEDENDWMGTVLQSNLFVQIPPANIQQMFMRMEQVNYKAGDKVIRYGDPGDYYYILKKGKCEVTRVTPHGKEVRLATLSQGAGFGEEALISDSVRNATVTMLTDGSLMRLSKEDFNELLKKPVLDELSYEEAKQEIADGAVWLDVRLENEYEISNLEGSINIPLYLLRLRASSLDPETHYIVYCDSGGRSSAAAYILSERGLAVSILAGGLLSVEEA